MTDGAGTHFGVCLPAFLTLESPDVLRDMAREAEAIGFDYVFTHEAPGPFMSDVWVDMTLMALSTQKVILGTNIINPYTTPPFTAARAAAAINAIAPGRVVVNWGAGNPPVEAIGIPWTNQLAVMREAVELSKMLLAGIPAAGEMALMAGKPMTYDGDHFKFLNSFIVPAGPVPVWVSTGSPRMLEMGGELADGVNIGHYTDPEFIKTCIERVHTGSRKAGRDASDVSIHVDLHVGLHRDPEQGFLASRRPGVTNAVRFWQYRKDRGIKLEFEETIGDIRDRSSRTFELFGLGAGPMMPPALFESVPREVLHHFVVTGTPDDCAAGLERLLLPEVDTLSVVLDALPPWSKTMPEALHLFAAEVLPHLQEVAKKQKIALSAK